MGISMQFLSLLDQKSIFFEGIKILDIGSSNLYSADEDDIEQFLTKYLKKRNSSNREFVSRLSKGSAYVPGVGGDNKAFVGELFEKAGFEYLSFDIAHGHNTEIFDLNTQNLPEKFKGKFDLVMNFGTTEHIINQLNCFKVIHEATKSGGYMFHQLPASGFSDHGYFTYTGRFFFDLAGYNEYEVVEFFFNEPAGQSDLFSGVRSYSSYFPVLKDYVERQDSKGESDSLNSAHPFDVGLNILYKKSHDKPFYLNLETSTSVGGISDDIKETYSS